MIGIFDSGIGGLTILTKLKELMPNEDYLFYEDSLNNPYGSKTEEELYKITSNIVDFLISKKVKIIVIACNTATVRCIKYLREKYPKMIFIGTEPAIKPALESGNNILLLATPLTVKGERTKELISKYQKDNQNIYLHECKTLAHMIEINNKKEIDLVLDDIYDKYKDSNIDTIILGCTHYPLIKDDILKRFKDVNIIDGSMGVAKETKRKLEENNLLSNNKKGSVTIINSLEKNYKIAH